MSSQGLYGSRDYYYQQSERMRKEQREAEMRRQEMERQLMMINSPTITHTSSGNTVTSSTTGRGVPKKTHLAKKSQPKKEPEGITDDEIYYSLIK